MRSMAFALAAAMMLMLVGCTVQVESRPHHPGIPPQYVAQLDYPIAGCERGPYALALMNRTDYYLDMTIDGDAIDFEAPEGTYFELPPWSTAYLCLEWLGDHEITGYSYYESYGELYPVHGPYGYFAIIDHYGSSVGPHGRQELVIDDSLLYYY